MSPSWKNYLEMKQPKSRIINAAEYQIQLNIDTIGNYCEDMVTEYTFVYQEHVIKQIKLQIQRRE